MIFRIYNLLKLLCNSVLCFGVLITTSVNAQISTGGDASLKFGESKNNFNYSEVLLNMNVSNDYLTTWFQFEYSNPPEIGLTKNGLRKFRVDYVADNIELSVGDIYKIWGRGLILNQFDDQDVDLDNGYRGLSFGLIENDYSLNLIAGNSNISNITSDYMYDLDLEVRKPNYFPKHSLFGGDLELFRGQVSLATSFLQSRESHPINAGMQPDSIDVIHRIHGLRSGYEGNSISGYVELANKLTLLPTSIGSDDHEDFRPYNGTSLFANLNYYFNTSPFDGWSLMMEYKNYNTTKINPDQRNNYVNNYDMNLIFTQPPTVIREHSSVLLARLIPQVNFNDEVGYQFSLVGPVSNLGYFTLNYQAASRTSLWSKEFPDTVNALFSSKWASDSSVTYLPYNDDVTFPYNELYVEMEGYINKIRYQLGFGYTNKISEYHSLYSSSQNNSWDTGESFTDLNNSGTWDLGEPFNDLYSIVNERLENKYTNAITVPTLFNYNLGNGLSIDLKYEYQRLKSGVNYNFTLSSDEYFEDLDGDGLWDMAELFTDDNENGEWDGAEDTWYDWWLNGWLTDDQLPDYDTNGNGEYDIGEQFSDADGDGIWDPAESFTDLDGDGVWDDGEVLDDMNNDGAWTPKGTYVDSTRSNFYAYDGDSDEKLAREFQNNHMLTIGLGKSPHWSLSLTIESSTAYEYGPQPLSISNPLEDFLGNIMDMENKWVAIDLMININSNTRLDLMYGTLRGGVICSNGICRYVEPFDDGFKLSLTSVF